MELASSIEANTTSEHVDTSQKQVDSLTLVFNSGQCAIHVNYCETGNAENGNTEESRMTVSSAEFC